MASSPIPSWQIDGETMGTVTDYFGRLQNHCRWWLHHDFKRCLLLGKEVMTNLDSIFKSRDITLPTKIHLVKTVVFPVVTYGCESWTIKKAEHQRIDAFEEKTLESSLDWKDIQPVHPKGNQSWIFIGRIDAEAEASILWPLDMKNWLVGKDLMLGKIEGMRRRGQWKMKWLDGITDLMDMSLSISGSWWWTGKPGMLQSMGLQRVGHDWATELNIPLCTCTTTSLSIHLSMDIYVATMFYLF